MGAGGFAALLRRGCTNALMVISPMGVVRRMGGGWGGMGAMGMSFQPCVDSMPSVNGSKNVSIIWSSVILDCWLAKDLKRPIVTKSTITAHEPEHTPAS